MEENDKSKGITSVYLSCHCFVEQDTEFTPNHILIETQKTIILNTKFIIIPYNINKNHWCLVICDITANKLLYFDSIHDYDGNRCATLFCRSINDWLSKLSVSV